MEDYTKKTENGTVAGPARVYFDDKRTTGFYYALIPVIYANRGVNSKGQIIVLGLNGHGTSKSRKKIVKHLKFRGIRVDGNLTIEDRVDDHFKPRRNPKSNKRMYDGRYY